jgi:hypothetical protein
MMSDDITLAAVDQSIPPAAIGLAAADEQPFSPASAVAKQAFEVKKEDDETKKKMRQAFERKAFRLDKNGEIVSEGSKQYSHKNYQAKLNLLGKPRSKYPPTKKAKRPIVLAREQITLSNGATQWILQRLQVKRHCGKFYTGTVILPSPYIFDELYRVYFEGGIETAAKMHDELSTTFWNITLAHCQIFFSLVCGKGNEVQVSESACMATRSEEDNCLVDSDNHPGRNHQDQCNDSSSPGLHEEDDSCVPEEAKPMDLFPPKEQPPPSSLMEARSSGYKCIIS